MIFKIVVALVGLGLGLAAVFLLKHRRRKLHNRQALLKVASNEMGSYGADIASLLTSIPGFLCLKNGEGRWLQVSQQYADIFNISIQDCLGKTDSELEQRAGIDLDTLRFNLGKDQEAWTLGQALRDEKTVYLSTDGEHEVGFNITRTPIYGEDRNKFRLLITGNFLNCRDTQIPGLFASVFYMNKIPFALLDEDFKVSDINKSFAVFVGYPKKECVGRPFVFIGSQTQAQEFAASLAVWFSKNRKGASWSGEVVCYTKTGHYFPVRLLISKLRIQTTHTKFRRYFACLFDITKEKEDEKRVMQVAHYDALTGLPSRILFCEQLGRALAAALRHQLHSAVLCFNLDRFKAVNNSLGRQTGDELLKQVSERLKVLLRKEDLVARLGGDDFAIMCFNQQSHEKTVYSASLIAQKVISRLSECFYINYQEIFVSLSVGIAIFPEDADNVETLLKNADIAMHEAKKLGSNNFQFFHKKNTSTAKDRHQLEVGLRKALQRNELLLHYQPQYRAKTRKLYGAEVLIRWLQEGTNLISPYYFIDVAEETGLIIPIGKWILETACAQQKAWLDAGRVLHQVSVNVSARQFMDPHFVETVEEVLAKTKLDPVYLELEITESLLIGDTKKIELQLNRLKKMGIKIALDDFGTGYSSLAYLKNFAIDVVKIDQSFVRNMTPGSKDAKIIRAIIEMGHSLGYKVVAEGVENEEQLVYLTQQGCDIIQGYYFSKPLPVQDMTKLLSQ